MAGDKPDVLLVGAKKPVMMKGFEGKVTLHDWLDAPGQGRFPQGARRQDPRHRRRLYRQQGRRRFHAAVPQARADLELRRRLRPHRRQMGGRARHRRHQHAGRAQRGGRRHRARPAAVHGARIPAGRPLSARRQMAVGALSAVARRRCAIAPSAWSAWAASARRSPSASRPSACRWSTTRAIRRPASRTNIIPSFSTWRATSTR